MKTICSFLAVLAILSGTISDKTTGQPLAGVTVTTQRGSHTWSARTDSGGRFALRRIVDGTYTLHLSSKDVPPQDFQARVKGNATRVNLRACSTTLDYHCGQEAPGTGGG